MPNQPATEPTVVVFRKWPDTGHVIALFPEVPWDLAGNECSSYMLVGEHSAASYYHVVQRTVPATPEEYAATKRVLETWPEPYRLHIVKRATFKHHQKRRDAAREL